MLKYLLHNTRHRAYILKGWQNRSIEACQYSAFASLGKGRSHDVVGYIKKTPFRSLSTKEDKKEMQVSLNNRQITLNEHKEEIKYKIPSVQIPKPKILIYDIEDLPLQEDYLHIKKDDPIDTKEEKKDEKKPPKLTLKEKLNKGIKKLGNDTLEYGKDIITWNSDNVARKTGHFIRRNVSGFCVIMHHVGIELKKLGKSFRVFKEDIKYSFTETRSDQKYKLHSYKTLKRMSRIKKDVIKFIPFSAFIIIPGLELLLPAWLIIFPNSIPSQFLSPHKRNEQLWRRYQLRRASAEKLLYIVPAYLNSLEKDHSLPKEDRAQISELKVLLREEGVLLTDLIDYKFLFKQYLDFKYFEPNTLLHIANFMSLEPVTGLNTLNNILSPFKKKVAVDSKYVKVFTKRILVRELKLYFKKLRREDALMSFENVEKFTESELDIICFERGIEIEGKTFDKKLRDLKLWMAISNLNNVPDSLLLFSRIVDFSEELFSIDTSEDDYEILRRVQSEVYFAEKLNIFEKAFGIDDLRVIIDRLNHKRKTFAYNPSQNQFVFQPTELKTYIEILNQFKMRHKTLSDKIEETYTLGNKMLDFLERQIILDFHLRGQQDLLEKEYPELAEKAQKYLGYEFYSDLSMHEEGVPLEDEKFKRIMELNDTLNKNFDDTMNKLKLASMKKQLGDKIGKRS